MKQTTRLSIWCDGEFTLNIFDWTLKVPEVGNSVEFIDGYRNYIVVSREDNYHIYPDLAVFVAVLYLEKE